MTSATQPMMTFALTDDGRMVHVDDVPTGMSCECTCPGCHKSLIAKNAGREKTHHFAHEAGTDAQGCAETALHQAAKQVVLEFHRIKAPAGQLSRQQNADLHLTNVLLEHRLQAASGDVVVDCYAQSAHGAFAIEIAVHHKVDDVKADKLQELSLPTLEIDLSDMVTLPWSWNELEDAVLFDLERRKWVEVAAEPSSFAGELDALTPISNLMDQWPDAQRFAVGNVWVWFRRLPYGNYSVYHRFDEPTRRIVESICRGRGRWEPRYKNWIVFDRFKDVVLSELINRTAPLDQ